MSASLAGPLEYHDIVVSTEPSFNVMAGASYVGFSASGTFAADLNGKHRHVSEGLLAYGHKLPIVDVHIATVWFCVEPALPDCKASVRASLNSNVSHRWMIEAAVEKLYSGNGRILSAAVTGVIYQDPSAWRVLVRAGASDASVGDASLSGGSVRAIIEQEFSSHLRLHAMFGFASSAVDNGTRRDSKSPVVAMTVSYSY